MMGYVASVGIGLAFFGAASFAVALTRFEGGVACFWVASAVLLAWLLCQKPRYW